MILHTLSQVEFEIRKISMHDISVEINFYKIKLTGLVIFLASHNNYNTTMQTWRAISIFVAFQECHYHEMNHEIACNRK